METMNQERAMDIMKALWEIVRDNKLVMDALREDFTARRRPCCAIRRMARNSMEKVQSAYYRFNKIAKHYGFDEQCTLLGRTDMLYKASVDHAVFFGA